MNTRPNAISSAPTRAKRGVQRSFFGGLSRADRATTRQESVRRFFQLAFGRVDRCRYNRGRFRCLIDLIQEGNIGLMKAVAALRS
ncbi:MAG: hypothetical protein R3A47_10815 [Polyangiales bacterium]